MTTVTIDAADPATKIVTGKEASDVGGRGVVTAYCTIDSGDPSDIRIAPVDSLAEVYPPQPVPNVLPLFPRGRPMWAVVDGNSGDKVKVETQTGRTVGEPSNAYVRATTFAVSAEGATEQNADQTASIPAGDSQTSTITADSGEVWNITGFGFKFDPTNTNWSNDSGDDVEITIESEKEAVEYGHAFNGSINTGETLEYGSDEWIDSSGNWNELRKDFTGHRIDATNGLNVTVDNQSSDHEIQGTREIRFEFDVIKT